MDVNFLVGTVLVAACIDETLILGHILVILLIIMGIPTTTLMEILIRWSMILRIALKNL